MFNKPKVAIINYGVGNVFSVKQACEANGLIGVITHSAEEIRYSDAVILPGVGAFATAMESLRRLHLIDVIKSVVNSSKLFMGICLGMQLLMERSHEFGEYEGLGIIKGDVIKLDNCVNTNNRILKVPQIGWNNIYKNKDSLDKNSWNQSLLRDILDNEFMYFVHSYYIRLKDSKLTISMSSYGNIEFCSSFQYRNIFACQFHPERSGLDGLKIYKMFADSIKNSMGV